MVLGGPLPHVMAAKAVAFAEARQPEFASYARRIVDNAHAFAEAQWPAISLRPFLSLCALRTRSHRAARAQIAEIDPRRQVRTALDQGAWMLGRFVLLPATNRHLFFPHLPRNLCRRQTLTIAKIEPLLEGLHYR